MAQFISVMPYAGLPMAWSTARPNILRPAVANCPTGTRASVADDGVDIVGGLLRHDAEHIPGPADARRAGEEAGHLRPEGSARPNGFRRCRRCTPRTYLRQENALFAVGERSER
jgi:hypothetical protein